MLANKVVSSLDQEAVRRKISEAFGYEVIGLLPLSEDMARMGSQGLLALEHPSHPLTLGVVAVADRLVKDYGGDQTNERD
jgi:hypothetical protein